MKRSMARTLCFIIAFPVGFASVSCTREDARQKEPSPPPAESPRISGEYQRRLEEAKKSVAAKVNGVPISRFDLVAEMNAIAPQYFKPGQKRDAKTDEIIRKEALDRLIYRELAVQQARREGMKAPADAVAEEMKRIKSGMKTEEAYRQNLAKEGATEEDLRGRIERNLLVEMIAEKEVFGKVTVDPDEALKVYEKRSKSHKGPTKPMTFEEARPRIEKELMTAAVQKREDEWVAEMKKGAKIEITP